ncbi:uncharacterized protein MONOS_13629 [Monocercomonoides exilis]|uniref:uncharacterized protein n=1 Tax=Monocercomonoides exilis TaxID=2049356 RepID=UPI00355A2BEA|nr:hypothetical protein MONOS_13629 [Monocercomonoides exilis]|eukprot:MONOS_13629.1-p1 / transcript=MONOS_13629.1 / gene=MONOS_13629 / organism=Monocercomonoides_exilis_PA203 / gene_product=unspecified product / transcript_product=unspecified product / location=Mono_scaffold00855:22820-23319(-) / protein_length=101 / sequence_SO=supercontig / SO=protein_coding / is_pseudo=false
MHSFVSATATVKLKEDEIISKQTIKSDEQMKKKEKRKITFMLQRKMAQLSEKNNKEKKKKKVKKEKEKEKKMMKMVEIIEMMKMKEMKEKEGEGGVVREL